tara:strand:+ start:343 stop:948 length:606 start_codon:yes stop_codon:yes gene_type:complete
MEQFEYIKGPAKTNIPWFRPRGNRLNRWKKAFFKIPGVEKYKFWICGGALEEWKTWDTDIIMIGEFDSYKELENILVTATQLGFKHRQLIDINWRDYKKSEEVVTTSAKYFIENNQLREVPLATVHDVCVITICSHIIKNGELMEVLPKEKIKLSGSLWKRKSTVPSWKQQQRIKEGIIYKSNPVLLTPDLDFRDIIKDKR